MTIQGTRFGTIDYISEDVVHFAEGLIGFSALQHFVLLATKEGSPFRWLQSVDQPAVAFLVSDPNVYVESYHPVIADDLALQLELDEATPTILYTTVTIPPGNPQDMTLNLAAPIVINARSRQAKQLVLDDHAYTIRHRVFPAADLPGEKQAA